MGKQNFMSTTQVLFYLSIPVWLFLFPLIFQFTPSDHMQGLVQKIFYLHVPTAWVSFFGFFLSFVYAIGYLKNRNPKNDYRSAAAAVTGWVFTTGVLITGPIWAKPIWGDWWNWSDQRLVSFFILWLSYSGYLLLRTSIHEPQKRARLSSSISILSFLNVPLVYFAIRLWNTPSHPGPVIAGDENSGMGPEMILTFWYSVFAFTLLFFLLFTITKTFMEQKEMAKKYFNNAERINHEKH